MMNLLLLIKTSRPLGWIIWPFVFLFGLAASGANLTTLPIIQMILLSFPFSFFAYGINDIYDYQSDKLNPRKNLIEGIKLKPKYHSLVKKSAFFIALILVSSSLITQNIYNVSAMLFLLFFAYFYSAPPLRLKERPPLDSFTNGIGYFFLPFLLGFSYGGTIFDIPIK